MKYVVLTFFFDGLEWRTPDGKLMAEWRMTLEQRKGCLKLVAMGDVRDVAGKKRTAIVMDGSFLDMERGDGQGEQDGRENGTDADAG
jgi:hypothetical protein